MSQQEPVMHRREDLFFNPSPSTSPQDTNAAKNVNMDTTQNEAAMFFGVDAKMNAPNSEKNKAPSINILQPTIETLAEHPEIVNFPLSHNDVNMNMNITPYLQQQRSVSTRRDISLYYVTEIAQFTTDDVNSMFLLCLILTTKMRIQPKETHKQEKYMDPYLMCQVVHYLKHAKNWSKYIRI
jgi:hypothetical protein